MGGGKRERIRGGTLAQEGERAREPRVYVGITGLECVFTGNAGHASIFPPALPRCVLGIEGAPLKLPDRESFARLEDRLRFPVPSCAYS